MNPSTRSLIVATLLATGLHTGPAAAAAIHGALFTTDVNGTVNVNLYDAKADVYLSGGPGPNAPCTAADLDDGTYVYQITNPSGTVLLSSDGTSPIGVREFTVANHVITSSTTHASESGDCGGILVQMIPFDDTPNNGGEYKAWITRKDDYIANNGFKPGSTKTDNFKVNVPAPPETSALLVYKFYDANGNGVWDGDEVPLFGWAMTASNGNGYNQTALTQSPDGLVTFSGLSVADNPYQVLEGTANASWVQSASIVNGVSLDPAVNPVTGLNLVAGETTQVDFGNYCTCLIKPYASDFWIGSAGQTKLNDGGTMNPEFTLLNNANLRNAAGLNLSFNTLLAQSTNYNKLTAYLIGAAGDPNIAYQLSAQLAVMKLNVEAGFVHPAVSFYKPYGGTIAQLIADANTLLSTGVCGATCNTTTATQLGLDQQTLAGFLADLNDGEKVIMTKPCSFKFTLPVN